MQEKSAKGRSGNDRQGIKGNGNRGKGEYKGRNNGAKGSLNAHAAFLVLTCPRLRRPREKG